MGINHNNICGEAFKLGFFQSGLSNRDVIADQFGWRYYWNKGKKKPDFYPSPKEFDKAVEKANREHPRNLFAFHITFPEDFYGVTKYPLSGIPGFPSSEKLWQFYCLGNKYRILASTDEYKEKNLTNWLGVNSSRLVRILNGESWPLGYPDVETLKIKMAQGKPTFFKNKEITIRCDEAYAQSQWNDLCRERFIKLPWYSCGGAIEVDKSTIFKIPSNSQARIIGTIGKEQIEVLLGEEKEQKIIDIP